MRYKVCVISNIIWQVKVFKIIMSLDFSFKQKDFPIILSIYTIFTRQVTTVFIQWPLITH